MLKIGVRISSSALSQARLYITTFYRLHPTPHQPNLGHSGRRTTNTTNKLGTSDYQYQLLRGNEIKTKRLMNYFINLDLRNIKYKDLSPKLLLYFFCQYFKTLSYVPYNLPFRGLTPLFSRFICL